MLRRIAPLFFWLFLLPIFCAPVHGADATSFDPTLVTVKANGTSSIPVGTIISWPVAQNPSDWQNSDGTYNWLECNGQSISASVYPELFELIGAVTPDLRELYLQGGTKSNAGSVKKNTVNKALFQARVADSDSWGTITQGGSGGPSGWGSSGGFHFIFTAFGDTPIPPNMAVRYLIRALP